jgi:hypothetical protein
LFEIELGSLTSWLIVTGGSLRKKVTVITVEQERVVEIRWRGQRRESRCEQCDADARMLTADEAAAIAGVSLGVISGWAAAGRLHITTTSEGLLLVCLNSLGRMPNGKLLDVASE